MHLSIFTLYWAMTNDKQRSDGTARAAIPFGSRTNAWKLNREGLREDLMEALGADALLFQTGAYLLAKIRGSWSKVYATEATIALESL